tara:strand:+ start:7725 stop:8000 length:276 start_codon:yes stop_codon:yes gene_type:complete
MRVYIGKNIEGLLQIRHPLKVPAEMTGLPGRLELMRLADLVIDVVDGGANIVKDRHYIIHNSPVVAQLTEKQITMLLMGILPKPIKEIYCT